MNLLTTTEQLADFCASLKGAEFITIDTEFMRERTYWSKLCLVQIAKPDGAVAIDPLAKGIDLGPLFALLADTSILKVFHAARQDVEIFFNLTGQIPKPMFDTQAAAMVCGFGDSVGYETLVGKLTGAQVDKSSRFTDWSNRPLTERQITYALDDVIHLRDVYRQLAAQIKKSGRASWMEEEMGILTNPATYTINLQEVWRRFKWRADKPRLCALLRDLAAWRETEAQRLNVPRNRILRDEAVAEIASHPPQSAHDLARIRGLSIGFAESRQGSEILEVVARTLSAAPETWPVPEKRRFMPAGLGPVIDMLKILLKQVSEEHGVASRLIATVDDLEEIAASDNAQVPALHGWRRELFGNAALALKHGELALSVKGKKVILIPRED